MVETKMNSLSDYPLVSVGIPTYNRASILKRAINSVLEQDYPNIELVISNNASEDNTEEICDKYVQKDDRVKYFRNTVNVGPTDNFLNVLHKSRGDYFMWLSDDDWIDSNYVRSCLEVITKDQKYSIVGGRAKYYSEGKYIKDGKIVNLLEESPSDRVMTHFKNIEDNVRIYGLMRRNQLIKAKFPQNMGGDWILVCNMAFLGKVLTLEYILIHREVYEYKGKDKFKNLALSIGVSKIQGKFPYLCIAARVFYEILFGIEMFKELEFNSRFILAFNSCKEVLEKYGFTSIIFKKGTYGVGKILNYIRIRK